MLQLNLHPSRYFLMLILFVHVAAVLVVLALPLTWWAIIAIESFVAGSFVHMIQKHVVRKSDKTIIAVWLEDNNWVLMNRNNDKFIATLLKDSSSSVMLVTLNFKLDNNKKQTVLIFPDTVDKLSFKRLRRHLKTGNYT